MGSGLWDVSDCWVLGVWIFGFRSLGLVFVKAISAFGTAGPEFEIWDSWVLDLDKLCSAHYGTATVAVRHSGSATVSSATMSCATVSCATVSCATESSARGAGGSGDS